ncbi:MAG: GAF domain-containing protein [Oscillatoriophycideae cyanobacterium NC_groundwater_1537_Pr4_S-0.65um_50_18]|nr:GAF domain-containing protein [Oscillatoriophycideae cyanobacterium NC_groundwater_1537_Pr4_S-0.65um_50_18]
MPDSTSPFLDAGRLLVDLQRVSEIVQSFSGCLEPEAIAKCATDGLVTTFGYAFARVWLVESDRVHLRLVASSGMYTRTDGSFARVPMGAFKVGKIAQNRIPFLSNHLAEEAWVKDRQWALVHKITGFAGYPLTVGDRVIGVLAVFSHQPLSSEFLEVLQGLCTTLAIVLDHATQHQRAKQILPEANPFLSEQLATVLGRARFSLVGTERSLTDSLIYLLIRTAEVLRDLNCTYCRLSYGATQIVLEAMVFPDLVSPHPFGAEEPCGSINSFGDLCFAAACLGGTLQTLSDQARNAAVLQVVLEVPYPSGRVGAAVQIQCRSPVLQMAFTHLAYLAGLKICNIDNPRVPLITDDVAQWADSAKRLLWVADPTQAIPKGAIAQLNLFITPTQLREAVEAAHQGKPWGMAELPSEAQTLSDREQEILTLLAQGLRDRDIAAQLYISERTVKFHINNLLTKLQARTRCQAIYEVSSRGWI